MRAGAERISRAVAPPALGVTSSRLSSTAAPGRATPATRQAPTSARRPTLLHPTAREDRKRGGGNQGAARAFLVDSAARFPAIPVVAELLDVGLARPPAGSAVLEAVHRVD